jgi:putative ABC transport system permease protein
MLLKNIRFAIRNFLKRRLFTSVNLSGLVLGLVAFLVLLAYVTDEWSYNSFHQNRERIYRLIVADGPNTFETYVAPGYSGVITSNFSEVEAANLIVPGIGSGLVAIAEIETSFREEEINFVDGTFFDSFSFAKISGGFDLRAPSTAVITREMALKFYGKADAAGEVFTLSNQFGKYDYKVVGVLNDIPLQSDIQGKIFLSLSTLENPSLRSENDWADPNGLDSGFATMFLLLKEGTDSERMESQLTDFIRNSPGSEQTNIILQPLSEMHLGSSIADPLPTFGKMGSVLVFLAIAILILAIAFLNYLNLSSASILTRIKEIRMRRILGAHSWHLAEQFMVETLLLLLVSLGVSMLLVQLISPDHINAVFGKIFSLSILWSPWTLGVIAGALVLCALLSGLHVVMLAGNFENRGKLNFKPENQWFRKSMVIIQFTVSVVIIISTFVIRDQLSFMQAFELGLNVDQRVVIPGPNDAGENGSIKKSSFKESLRNQSFVKGLGASNNIPGQGFNFSTAGITPMVPRPEDKDHSYSMLIIDENFIPVYEIEMAAGRNFSADEAAQNWNNLHKVMLNEKAAIQLGFESPEAAIGQSILWGEPFEVVGIVKDYHHLSLKEEIKPTIFLASQADGYFTIALPAAQMKENLATIQDMYESFFPGNPFSYFFMDELYANQYRQEGRLSTAFTIAGILAILISCLGLFALAAFSVQLRTKEIGIRKVMGASSQSIVQLLSRDFSFLVGIAILISFPISWYLMRAWQMDFPYKSGLSPMSFLLAGGICLLVAMLTVGMQALKAAWANPVESIRSE